MNSLIDKSWKLGDIVKQHPGLLPVMGDAGLPVNGCSMPAEDTLEQLALMLGWSDEEVNKLVEDLNHQIESNVTLRGKDGLLNITQNALDKMKELMGKQDREGYGLRLSVAPGGCAGYTYGLMFSKEPTATDEILDINGVKFFVDGNNLSLLQGIEVDYVDALQGAGFKITNPNAKKSCACGSSFR